MNDDELHEVLLAVNRTVREASVGGALEETGGWMLVDSGTGLPTLNFAIVAEPEKAAGLELVERWFEERAGFRLILRIPGDARVLATAQERGYRMTRSQPVMARPLPLEQFEPPADVQIRSVRTRGDIADYLSVRKANLPERPSDDEETEFIERIMATGKFRYFVAASSEGRAVATSSVAVAGRAASISNVWVAEDMRKQGLGAAMTAAAAAGHGGVDWLLLEASAMGEPVYRRMGFHQRFRYLQFAPPPEPAEG